MRPAHGAIVTPWASGRVGLRGLGRGALRSRREARRRAPRRGGRRAARAAEPNRRGDRAGGDPDVLRPARRGRPDLSRL